MADPRFFRRMGPFTLAELAAISGAEPAGDRSRSAPFEDVAPLQDAGPDEVGFFDNPRYLAAYRKSAAGACVVSPEAVAQAPAGMALLVTEKPYRAYALIARAFYPEETAKAGIHARATVSESAAVAESAEIGANCVIEAGAEIGARSVVKANCTIGPGVVVGPDCIIGPNATLSHCIIGARCRIHPGVRIGNRGFGFTMDPEGYLDIPQLGRVVLENDVEVGANSTIDRGAGPDTHIGAGCKIDNLVMLGHNVRLGKGCVLVSQAGIAGSTKLEDYVVVGGQGGISGHLTIGKGAKISAQAGVIKDIPPGLSVTGFPAMPNKEFFRLLAWQRRQSRKKGGGE